MNIYNINEKQLKSINVLIRALQEAINRKSFNESEINNIKKTIDSLNQEQ
tara:strand:- start:754 stop:903 length:150 start_codon:yes stop_codon:yes gene_type:complete